MKDEIAAAVVFLTRLVRESNQVDKQILEGFSNELTKVLVERFKNHWYEDAPTKGQAYRCIRVTETEPVDPVLERVARACDIKAADVVLPAEFTLWIDPHDVTCRFGESLGTTYYTVAAVLDDGRLDNQAHALDVVEMVRTDNLRKAHELLRLQESARRRRHRHTHHLTKPAGGTQKKYTFYPGNPHLQQHGVRRVSPTEQYMEPAQLRNRIWYNASPTHQSAAAAIAAKDRFHWVRNDAEMIAA